MPSDPLSGGSGGSKEPHRPSGPTSDQQESARGGVPSQGQPPEDVTAESGRADKGRADKGRAEKGRAEKEHPEGASAANDRPAGVPAQGERGRDRDLDGPVGTPGLRPPPPRSRLAASRGIATVLLAIGDTWGAILVLGCASLVLGAVVLAWPGRTLAVVAVLFALQILVYGLFYVAQAIAAEDIDGGRRVLVALLGVVALVIGVLMLRDVTHTVEVLALLLGLFWIVVGAIGVMSAFVGRARPGRGLALLAGFLGIVAGIVVLAYPALSLTVLVAVLGVWLVVFGALTIAIALQVRAARRAGPKGRNRGVVVGR